MHEYQPTISAVFKTRKRTTPFLDSIKPVKRKQQHDKLTETNFQGEKEKTAIYDCQKDLSQSIKDITSKSTIASIQDEGIMSCSSQKMEGIVSPLSSPKYKELSTKTRNIIAQIMNKKTNITLKRKDVQSKLQINNDMLIYSGNHTLKNNEQNNTRFSVNNNNKQILTGNNNNIVNNNDKCSLQTPPKLSEKALSIINHLKQTRQNRLNLHNSNNNVHPVQSLPSLSTPSSSFSLRFKYEELLNRPRSLPLPPKYKLLFNSFITLDQTINLNKLKVISQTNTFSSLQSSIESTTHHKFTLKTFQQILYIVPHFFIYKYEPNSNNNYDLIIDIPNDHINRINQIYPPNNNFILIQYQQNSFNCIVNPITQYDLNKRREIFKNILYEIVNDYHNKYLNENNIKIQFDVFKSKTWHHEFDLEKNCEDIPQHELVQQPQTVQVFQKVINEKDIRSQIMKDAIDLVNEGGDKTTNDNNDNNNDVSKELSKYVSADFIKKIKMKENAIKISNEICDYNFKVNNHKQKEKCYMDLLILMKTFFVVKYPNTIGSFEINELIDKIVNSNKNIKSTLCINNNNDGIIKALYDLAKMFPKLIEIKHHSSLGKVVIMNTKIDLPSQIDL